MTILFAAAGTWGDTQHHVALAQHMGGILLCDRRWSADAARFGIETRVLCEPVTHDFTIAGFLAALDLDTIFYRFYAESAGMEAIVSPFFLWPAKIVAEMRGIPWIATTYSPIYFREIGAVSPEQLRSTWNILNKLRIKYGLLEDENALVPSNLIGCYPSWIGKEHFPIIGYPHTPPLGEQPELPADPYCLVSIGSACPHAWIDEAIEASHAIGLYCLYAGASFEDDGALGIPFDVGLDFNRILRGASVTITHGGVGTLTSIVEAKTPVIVRPYAFDQFHNATVAETLGAVRWPSLSARPIDADVATTQHILRSAEALIQDCL